MAPRSRESRSLKNAAAGRVIDPMAQLVSVHGAPQYVRSDSRKSKATFIKGFEHVCFRCDTRATAQVDALVRPVQIRNPLIT